MAPDRLSQAELETLLATVQFDARPPAAKLSATTLSPSQDPSTARGPAALGRGLPSRSLGVLRTIHERFAALLGPALARLVRAGVVVRLVSLDQMRFAEFLAAVEPTTCLNVLGVAPLKGPLLLDQSHASVFPLIDRMLGGGREPTFVPSRALTEIETRLWSRVNAIATASLAQAWSSLAQIEPRVERIESRPSAARVAEMDECVVSIRFQLSVDEDRGHWSLCIPCSALEPLRGRLAGGESTHDRSGDLSADKLQLVAVLAETMIDPEDLANLALGDIVATDQLAGACVTITSDDVPRFAAQSGASEGRKAVRIESALDAPGAESD